MNRLIRLVVLGLLALPALAGSGKPEPMRLPDVATPLAYRLSLEFDPAKPRHRGDVAIDVEVRQPSATLRLNATDLAIRSALLEAGGRTLPAQTRQLDDDLLELRFAEPLPTGRGTLKLRFEGKLQDKDVYGLFRQKEGGDWYAFTQFESTGARMAFPGFDEPGWKVPWTLSLTVPAKLTAVANTPVEHETPQAGGKKRVDFKTSQPMPSYLLAFGVGPFDVLDGGRVGNTALRYITPRGRAAEAQFAAGITPRIVERLEAYFGMPYPYEKLDSLVLPVTVNFGAMENAGLITYASNLIMAKPGEETGKFRRDYVAVAAHELSHQWFGNYVTMAWWDDLWLNEAFASWMGDKITDQTMPEWGWDSSVLNARREAMWIDRLQSTRRIHQPVLVNHDLGGAFDHITYQKGQAVLAMFETWLGPERFRAGVRRYMARHAWGNATGDDFLAALGAEEPALAVAFRTFTEQIGIPRVAVELSCAGKPTLKLSQSRFLPRGSTAPADARWQVPLSVRTPAGTARLLLTDRTGELALPDASCPAWVQANAGGSGYYRPVYAPGQLQRLMRDGKPTVNEILAGLDDAAALTESGDLPLADALALAEQYAGHPRREVVEAAAEILLRLRPLVTPELRPGYAMLWQRAFGRQAHALGWAVQPGESDDARLLRVRLLEPVAEHGGDIQLREEARRLTRTWLKSRRTIDASVRPVMLRVAALDGDRKLFEAMRDAARRSDNRQERTDLYGALGNFRAPKLAEAARGLLLDPAHDIREVRRPFMRSQNANEALRQGSLRFIETHYDALAGRLDRNGPGGLPRDLDRACSRDEADAFERVFGPRADRYEGGPKTLTQTLETVRLCVAWREAQTAALAEYLGARR
ncbi:M1 family metallopeptidase [Chitinimonas koreensis]|uniref:M1 family metallopeptidase n=1 Tax=Chitinimonas koreensis TaxID=356302 RepID=UPI0003F7DD3C|nr:M1 family metallopeptidase [Chitinimonas koreensis]QNM94749.1 ERAP1-like C-terminal domain-containing protein [Chitinimonas koreensis]